VNLPLPISIAIITYNEEMNLGRCLQSVAELASEIIVVDSGSTDGTIAIAKKFQAIIQEQAWLGYRDQKNAALALCSQPWVLALDADEEVSPELKKSLIAFFEQRENQHFVGARFPRKTWFLGRWITHGDWYPDFQLRLFRRDKARWKEPIHEFVELDGARTTLSGELLHYSFPSMNRYIDKINPFADAFVKKEMGKSWSLWATLTRPLWRFFRGYILRRGFLDGFPGLWIAVGTCFSTFVRYSRGYEIKTAGSSLSNEVGQ
jgi:glycosyltransferase involved in cell wall biosynthesis